jgi:uncharacterized membrane protein
MVLAKKISLLCAESTCLLSSHNFNGTYSFIHLLLQIVTFYLKTIYNVKKSKFKYHEAGRMHDLNYIGLTFTTLQHLVNMNKIMNYN